MTSETKNRLDLPWKAGTGSDFVIYDSTGHRRIFESGADDYYARDFVDLNGPEDAAFIVRAVNNHEALVAMVRELRGLVRVTGPMTTARERADKLLVSLEKPDV